MEEKIFWEILVPTRRNDGRPIKTRFHRVWDKKVKTITGGLTIMPASVNGHWVSPEGITFTERMIPVRIVATRKQMKEIASMSLKYYDQEAIMYYVLSPEVHILRK